MWFALVFINEPTAGLIWFDIYEKMHCIFMWFDIYKSTDLDLLLVHIYEWTHCSIYFILHIRMKTL